MDIRLDILPQEDTTPGEIASMTHLVAGALERSADVESVAAVQVAAPGGAKGLLAEVGALLLGFPAGAITGVLDIIRTIAARQRQPVVLKLTAGGVEVSFDPRDLSPERLAALVAQLRPPEQPRAPA